MARTHTSRTLTPVERRPLRGRPSSPRLGLKYQRFIKPFARRFRDGAQLTAEELDKWFFEHRVYAPGDTRQLRDRRYRARCGLNAAASHYRVNATGTRGAFYIQYGRLTRGKYKGMWGYVVRSNFAALLHFEAAHKTLRAHQNRLRQMDRLIRGQDWDRVSPEDQRTIEAQEYLGHMISHVIVDTYNLGAIKAGLPSLPLTADGPKLLGAGDSA